VVYAKPPFAGPKAVLAYLARYTHRIAISSRRILAFDGVRVSFRVKDYRRDEAGRPRIMTLSASEFIGRFLLHVLPRGFHRIRHYGLLTGSNRTAGLAHIRTILGVPAPPRPTADAPDPPGRPRPGPAALPLLRRFDDDPRLLRGLASAPWAALPLHVERAWTP